MITALRATGSPPRGAGLAKFFLYSTRIQQLPSPAHYLSMYGLKADKGLSQNFLLSPRFPERIASAALQLPPHQSSISAEYSQNVDIVEVGPGLGSLTRALLCKASAGRQNVRLLAVEKDRRFQPVLNQLEEASEGMFKTVYSDILAPELNIRQELQSLRCAENRFSVDMTCIVGNLPYQISSVLLVQWMRQLAERSGVFSPDQPPVNFTLMLQREVGARLIHPTGRNTSRLSMLIHSLCTVRELFIVPSSAFTPVPKVDGMVIQIVPLPNSLLTDVPFNVFSTFLGRLFQERRKMIRRNIQTIISEVNTRAVPADIEKLASQLFDQVGLSGNERVEELHVKKICELAQMIYKSRKGQEQT